MAHGNRPAGRYFTEVYRVPAPLGVDSERARRRLGHFLNNQASKVHWAITKAVNFDLGLDPPTGYESRVSWDEFLPRVTG